MDIKSFIESGILEAYVAGQCSPEERLEVERLAAAHPEVRAELDAVEAALERVAQTGAVAPPVWMKERILQQIEIEKNAAPPPPKPSTPKGKYLISKPLVWIFCFLGVLWFLRNWQLNFANRALETKISGLELELKTCTERDANRKILEKQIAFLSNPATEIFEMKHADGRAATAFYNQNSREAYLSFVNLPALDGQDYQLWVIAEGNAAPQPLDVFQPGDSLLSVQFREKAQAFAISIEPKGGSPTGTPTTVLMLGKAAG